MIKIRTGFFLLFLVLIASGICAQNLVVSHDKSFVRYDNYEDKVDYLLIFNEINSSTELSFEPSTGHSFKWYTYDTSGQSAEISNQNYINPENNTGYVVEIDGQKKWIWVIDYLQYLAKVNALVIEEGTSPCSSLSIRYEDSEIPMLNYVSRTGILQNIKRIFTLGYTTLIWNDGDWQNKEISLELDGAITTWGNIEPPLEDGNFILSGDQIARELGAGQISVQSELYQAVKLEVHIQHLTSVRKEKNEANNPSDSTILTGSAPLEIQFEAKVNSTAHGVINWTIFAEGLQVFTQNGDGFRYIFDKAGSFYVKALVSNEKCTAMDSVLVKVDESAIYAPNVFTPNGDGINDEFRVAYKSIVSFRADVFNRWGKKLFSWTDPQKGWDGTVNGVAAKPGPYFYVIQAIGSEGKKYELKGDINLLRGSVGQ